MHYPVTQHRARSRAAPATGCCAALCPQPGLQLYTSRPASAHGPLPRLLLLFSCAQRGQTAAQQRHLQLRLALRRTAGAADIFDCQVADAGHGRIRSKHFNGDASLCAQFPHQLQASLIIRPPSPDKYLHVCCLDGSSFLAHGLQRRRPCQRVKPGCSLDNSHESSRHRSAHACACWRGCPLMMSRTTAKGGSALNPASLAGTGGLPHMSAKKGEDAGSP